MLNIGAKYIYYRYKVSHCSNTFPESRNLNNGRNKSAYIGKMYSCKMTLHKIVPASTSFTYYSLTYCLQYYKAKSS